jgi:hypothetical protein
MRPFVPSGGDLAGGRDQGGGLLAVRLPQHVHAVLLPVVRVSIWFARASGRLHSLPFPFPLPVRYTGLVVATFLFYLLWTCLSEVKYRIRNLHEPKTLCWVCRCACGERTAVPTDCTCRC